MSAPASSRFRHAFHVLVLLAGLTGQVQGDGASPAQSTPVYVVEIDGPISPSALSLLRHGIETAEAGSAAALVVRIDTPGGLLATTREMVHAIAESPVPVIGYVGPTGASATSAGAFILLATHHAVMNTGTNVGASSPVAGDGSDIEGTMGRKVMNDTRAFMRSVANSRGRNVEVAESFVTEAESLTAREALDAGVIDTVVPEFDNLLAAVDGSRIEFHGKAVDLALVDSEIRPVEPRLIDRLLQLVAHPGIAHMLLSLGFLAIYIEILSPGLAVPGVFGAIAVILGFVGVQTLPVNTGFMMLLLLGLTLMAAEYFVSGFGVLGIGGAVAFVLGSLNLFDGPIPDTDQSTITAVSVAVSGAVLATTFLVGRSILGSDKTAKSVVGKTGEAMVNMPAGEPGHVLIGGERWPARSEQALDHGDQVVVLAVDENDRLQVGKAEK